MGLLLVLVQIKPFWVDEWFVLDNLKNKTVTELFGKLNFDQQFPRPYLVVIKLFSSFFNYSYFSLRCIPYLAAVAAIVLCYKVTNTIFKTADFSKYLLVLIIVSSFTFTEYFVEVKQYTMEIFLSILAIWQFSSLITIQSLSGRNWVLLSSSFLFAPFFSYTYVIVILPVYIIMAIKLMLRVGAVKLKTVFPLSIGAISLLTFFFLDERHLMNDKHMYDFWQFLITDNHHKLYSILLGIYTLFSQTGSGIVFETIFGILGICSYVSGIYVLLRAIKRRAVHFSVYMVGYCCLVITIAIVLFLFKKLPLGTPRLNCFSTASIAILIIYFITAIADWQKNAGYKLIIPLILYAGLIGNIYTTYINYFTGSVYKNQLVIYKATQQAIALATEKNIPLFITPGITYPYQQAALDAGLPDPQLWVLKTFPAYRVDNPVPVYAITDTAAAHQLLQSLPVFSTALVGDGSNYAIIKK